MAQKRIAQYGMFHITTNAQDRIPWCVEDRMPEIIIDNLMMTRSVHGAQLHAFCVLPDHVHFVVTPGDKGLSSFVHSFKKNSSRDISSFFNIEGRKWQRGYYDEMIRDEVQARNALRYVENNAVKHGIVDIIDDWPWSSVHFHDQINHCSPS